MCHDKKHQSMISVTHTSVYGHGVCCKSNYEGDFCNNDGKHQCSPPAGKSNKYNNVLTNEKNH